MERPLARKTTEKNEKSSLFPFFFCRFPATGGIDSLLPQPSIARELGLSVQVPFRAFRDFPSVPLFLFSLDLLLELQRQAAQIARIVKTQPHAVNIVSA